MLEPASLNPAELIEQEFSSLLEQVRQGSEEAAWDLIERYGEHILRVVRRSLHEDLRSKFDSHDFVQAVWVSFFNSRSKIVNFQTSDDLIRFLATVARNKVVDEHRRRLHHTKYNVRREISLDDRTLIQKEKLPDNHATPSQVAVARERWQNLMAAQPDVYRRAITLRYQGQTYQRIAELVGLHERTVRKFFEQLFGDTVP